ncbi:DNA polymerase III subunit gamma/tau, partial [Pseudomonas aeruginosa]
ALPEAIDNGQGDRERVLALAQALPAEDVQFYYQMGLIGRRDLPLAPDPRSGFEMVLLRMLAFRPADADGV